MANKRCPRCGLTYADPAASFWRHGGRPDGLQIRCKACMTARYERERETINAKRRASYQADERRARRLRIKAAVRLLIKRD